MTESDDKVVYTVSDQVATVRFNRPSARNALDGESIQALHEALGRAADDERVRVVVLTGTGNTFSAGADVKSALATEEGGFAAAGPQAFAGLLAHIQDCPVPTIARIQGNVFGGGNGLAAACDLSVAADDTTFAFSEVRLGLVPAVISVVCLPKMTAASASELLLLGERVPAHRVCEAGLINSVVPRAELDVQVRRWTVAVLRSGPGAVAGTKELIRTVRTMDRTAGFEHASYVSGQYFRSEEAREGMTALLQKRRPAWDPEKS